MDPKQKLADLIDTFAAAKASGNEALQRMALQPIQEFFATHNITPIEGEGQNEVQG